MTRLRKIFCLMLIAAMGATLLPRAAFLPHRDKPVAQTQTDALLAMREVAGERAATTRPATVRKNPISDARESLSRTAGIKTRIRPDTKPDSETIPAPRTNDYYCRSFSVTAPAFDNPSTGIADTPDRFETLYRKPPHRPPRDEIRPDCVV
jgi:hypothetical protein